MQTVQVIVFTLIAGTTLCSPAIDNDIENNAGLKKCCPVGHMMGQNGNCIADVDGGIWYPNEAFLPDKQEETNSLPTKELKSEFETAFPCNKRDKKVAIYDSVGSQKEFKINPENGILSVQIADEDTVNHFVSSQYCVDRMQLIKGDETFVWIAYYCPCLGKTCIRKCCPRGQAYNSTFNDCQKSYPEWEPKIYTDDTNPKPLNIEKSKLNEYHFITTGFPQCSMFRLNDGSDQKHEFYLLENGNVRVPSYDNKEYSYNEYCLDTFVESNWVESPEMLVCFPEVQQKDISFQLYSTFALISSCFLFATFAYYVFYVQQKTVHDKTLMGTVASMFFAFIFLSINQLFSPGFGAAACKANAYLSQLTFIATFVWLQVMCVDAWKTHLDLLSMVKTKHWSNSSRRFERYLLYACTIPLVWTLITAFIDFLPGMLPFIVDPGIGKESCWFASNLALLVYFYAPIGLLLLSNLVFCMMAFCVQKQIHSDIQSYRLDFWQLHCYDQQKKRLQLCLIVYLVMGLLWTMEIVSWVVGGPQQVWYFTDIMNCLQGVLIFILFVCFKKYFSPTMNTDSEKSDFASNFHACNSDTTPIWKQ